MTAAAADSVTSAHNPAIAAPPSPRRVVRNPARPTEIVSNGSNGIRIAPRGDVLGGQPDTELHIRRMPRVGTWEQVRGAQRARRLNRRAGAVAGTGPIRFA